MKISELPEEIRIKAIAYSRILKYVHPDYKYKMKNREWLRCPFDSKRSDILTHEFIFSATPEGVDYWFNWHNKTV